MNKKALLIMSTAGVLTFSTLTIVAQQDEEPPEMGFFVTSVGIGDGANLGDCLALMPIVMLLHLLRVRRAHGRPI